LLPANRLGSEDSVVRAVARRGSTRRFATLHSACSPAALPSWSRVEDVQELAADAYPCIMVWVFGPAAYKDVARVSCTCPQLPSTSSSRSQQVCRRARSPQGQAFRWPPDGRPSLDRSCARRRQNLAVGARESLRRGRTREIRIGQQRKLCRGRAKQLRDEKNGKAPSCTPLTKKAPYKSAMGRFYGPLDRAIRA